MSENRGVALVTGASRGIGRGIAIALANAGFDVVVNYASNRDAAEEVGKVIEGAGPRALLVQGDVSVPADREKLVNRTYAELGRLDLLVNNAGIAPTVRADILESGEESFDRMVNINLKGPYFLTQLVARRMIEQQEGSVQGSGFGVQGSGFRKRGRNNRDGDGLFIFPEQ